MTATRLEPATLAATLGAPERWLVVLDLDGTLAPIVDDPAEARLADGAADAIDRLAARTTVAIVSGRHLDDLAAIAGPLGTILVGGHGAQVARLDGTRETTLDIATVRAPLDAAEREVRTLVDEDDGWRIERKPASLAVHYRKVSDEHREKLLPDVRAALLARRDDEPGFELLDGKRVLELQPRGVDKGGAVARLLAATPGIRPLVVGDDRTDEFGFAVARRRGGVAVLVAEVDLPASVATHRLRDPAEVVTFLEQLAEADRPEVSRG